MVIEWLTFAVPADWQDRFIAADERVWTPFLATCSGYVGKQIWRNPAQPDRLVQIIHWQSRAQWKAIPPADLARVDQAFREALGRDDFPLVESAEYVSLAVGGRS
jgi:uncharacterized protein (TIGR03792 family)